MLKLKLQSFHGVFLTDSSIYAVECSIEAVLEALKKCGFVTNYKLERGYNRELLKNTMLPDKQKALVSLTKLTGFSCKVICTLFVYEIEFIIKG